MSPVSLAALLVFVARNGPASVTWRLHLEPVLSVGGFRALYLHAMHPQVDNDRLVAPLGRRLREQLREEAGVLPGLRRWAGVVELIADDQLRANAF